jgi:signal transduction histidine kinase
MHGGAMRIRSKLGQGTMVVVRLPAEARPQARLERFGAAA